MIIRLRKRLKFGDGAEDFAHYVSVVFAHISNIIRVANVEHRVPAAGAMFGGVAGREYVELNVTYELQPSVAEGFDVVQAIRDAVGLRDDLEVLQLEQPPVVVKIPAIVQAGEAAGSTPYAINPIFARFVATNPQYLQQLRENNVHEVRLVCHRIPGGNLLRYAGALETAMRGGEINPNNPYQRIAGLVMNDLNLRTTFATHEITRIELRVTPGAGAELMITEAVADARRHEAGPAPRMRL